MAIWSPRGSDFGQRTGTIRFLPRRMTLSLKVGLAADSNPLGKRVSSGRTEKRLGLVIDYGTTELMPNSWKKKGAG